MSGKVAVALVDGATHWKNCLLEGLQKPAPARFCRSYASSACRTSQISEEMGKDGIGLGADSRLRTRGLSRCANALGIRGSGVAEAHYTQRETRADSMWRMRSLPVDSV